MLAVDFYNAFLLFICIFKYQGSFTIHSFQLHIFSNSSGDTSKKGKPAKDIIIKSTRATRSNKSKELPLGSLDTSYPKKAPKPDSETGTKTSTQLLDKKTFSDKKQVLKKTSIRDSDCKKDKSIDEVEQKAKDIPVPSIEKITESTSPENPEKSLRKQTKKSSEPKELKDKLKCCKLTLAKKLQNEKKQIEFTKTYKLKQASDIEVVDVSSDSSDLEDDEFRKIFENVGTNIDFDVSDITDEEVISSDDAASEASSSCILLEADEPISGTSLEEVTSLHSSHSDSNYSNKNVEPHPSTSTDITIPVLPKNTTISRIPVHTKSKPTNVKSSKNVNKNIEVVELE